MSRFLFRSVVFVVAVSLCGCGASSDFHTQSLGSNFSEPKRILIVETSAEKPEIHKSIMEAFRTALIDRLKNCGVATDYIHISLEPEYLSLDNPEKDNRAMVEVHTRDFAPDFMLTIQERLYDTKRYQLELMDIVQQKTVWNGSVRIEHAGIASGLQHVGVQFARDLVQQMQQDGMLKTCPALPKNLP